MPEKRTTVTNTSDRRMFLLIEPEEWDWWLWPGESVELRAAVTTSAADFRLTDNSDGVTACRRRACGPLRSTRPAAS